MTNKFKALGATKKFSVSELFNFVVKSPQVKVFKTTKPKMFSRLLVIQNATRERPEGKLKVQNLFDFLYPNYDATCFNCKKETPWGQEKGCYREFCSLACVNSCKDIVKRRSKTVMEKYGVTDVNTLKFVQKKKVKTFLANYGVDNPSKADSVKAKKSATMQKNFGEDHWTKNKEHFAKVGTPFNAETLRKARVTSLKRYGADNPLKVAKIQEQIKQTNLLRYGTTNQGHIPNGFKRKKYLDKFGTKHIVQGYEPQAIAWLEKRKEIESIISGSKFLPVIKYKVDGKYHYYHPDLAIYVDGVRHLMEVKSTYTIKLDPVKLQAKFTAAQKYLERRGGNFWVVIVGRRKVYRFNKVSVADILVTLKGIR